MALSRRRFFCLATGGAASAGALAAWRNVDGWVAGESVLRSATRTSWALGSDVSITALHADEHVARTAIDDAFAELELVESVMSIYRPTSQLSQLNRQKELHKPHPYFAEVLAASRAMSRESGGAFDITVQPLWSLFADAQKAGRLPSDDEIARARALVDWQRVEVSASRVALRGAGTTITLNGIAQGFAADRAAAALRKHGVEHALVNAGEIDALGVKPNGEPWRVGIQHPRLADAYISLVELEGRSLATSGDYATSFSADHRANHIFDPRTGRSPTELASVSIAAPSAMQADALSTAVFVLGPDAGLELARSTPGADAFFVLKSGRTLATDNFPLEG